jgi:hypothetical protein
MNEHELAIEVAAKIKSILADLKDKGGFKPANLEIVNAAIDKIDEILNDERIKNNPTMNSMISKFATTYRKLRDDYFKAHEGIL